METVGGQKDADRDGERWRWPGRGLQAGPKATGKDPLLGALGSTKDEEGRHNPMVLGYLLCAAPGNRYLLIHAV